MTEIDIEETIETVERRLASGMVVAYRVETRREATGPKGALYIISEDTMEEMLARVAEDWGLSEGMSNEQWSVEVDPGRGPDGEIFATTPWTIMSMPKGHRPGSDGGGFVPMAFVAACTAEMKLVYEIGRSGEIDGVD